MSQLTVNKQGKLVSAITALFPNNIHVYAVGPEVNDPNDFSLLHRHFYEPLNLENWQALSDQIAGFLQQQDPDVVYSFFNRSHIDPTCAETGWCLSSARLIKTGDGLPKEVVIFTYDLTLLEENHRKKIYRVLENDAFFTKHLDKLVLLTKREREVMGVLCAGMSSKQAAQALYISEHTVNTHRKSIHRKLATDNVAGLLEYVEAFDLFTEKTAR